MIRGILSAGGSAEIQYRHPPTDISLIIGSLDDKNIGKGLAQIGRFNLGTECLSSNFFTLALDHPSAELLIFRREWGGSMSLMIPSPILARVRFGKPFIDGG